MNKHYSQAVAFFGAIVPVLFIFIAIGAILLIKSSLMGDFETKKAAYTSEQQLAKQAEQIKNSLGKKTKLTKEWEDLTSGDIYQAVTTNVREAVSHSKTKTLVVTSEGRSPSMRDVTKVVKHGMVGIDFSLQGTYQEIQTAAVELETQMPNLFVKSFRFDANDDKLLQLNLTYLAWSTNPN